MSLSRDLQEACEAIRRGDAASALPSLEGAAAGATPEASQVRAVALASVGRWSEALRSARAALLLAPGYEPALQLIDRLEGILASASSSESVSISAAVAAPPRGREWQTGEVIEERWKIFGSAQGGMGRVYFVRDREWGGMELAVKSLLLRPGIGRKEAEEARRLFRRETQVWLDLGTHTHIVSGFYTLDIEDELRFFMEYVDGRSLERVMRDGEGRLSLPNALDLAIQLAAGMEYVHARDVAHRDLKPSNVLVDRGGVLRVMDFGLGKSTSEADQAGTAPASAPFGLSMIGAGTPHYMAPEQWRSLGEAGKPADVYAFGVTLYELLSGLRPFDLGESYADFYGERLPDVLRRLLRAPSPMPLAVMHLYHTQVEPVPLRELAPELPAGLEQLAARCLRKEAAERPPFGEIRRTLLGLYRPSVGAAYGREIPDVLGPSESGESNRAVSYYVMGETAKAAAILDAWLAREPDALAPWMNRKTIAINRGEVEPAAMWDEYQELLARHGSAGNLDAELAGFAARIGARVFPHGEPVTAIAFHPAADLLLAASCDRSARLFDLASGSAVRTLAGHAGAVLAAAFSEDGALAATGSADGSVRVWDSGSGALLRVLPGAAGRVLSVAFSGEILAAAGEDRVVRLHDARSGGRVAVFTEAPGTVNALAFGAGGKLLVAACGDPRGGSGWLEIRETRTEKLLRGVQTPACLLAVAFAPDGRLFVTGGADRCARVWSGQNGSLLRTLEGHRSEVTAVAVSRDGARIATGGGDRVARIIEARTFELERVVEGHNGPVTALAFSPDGNRLATASGGIAGRMDHTVRIWSVQAGAPAPPWPPVVRRGLTALERVERERTREDLVARLESHDLSALAEVQSVRAFTADYQRDQELVGAVHRLGFFGGIRSGVRDAWCSLSLPAGSAVTSVAFLPDGRSFVSSGWDGRANLWDTGSGRRLVSFEGHGREVTAVAIAPGGRLLATASADGKARVFERGTGVLARELSGHEAEITSLAFGPGDRLLTGSRDRTLRLWNTMDGGSSVLQAGDVVAAVAFGPAGRTALWAEGESVLARDPASGLGVLKLEGHGSRVSALAVSPDGRLVATGSRDRTAALWDSATGRRLVSLAGHEREVICADFSPDGVLVVTGSRDRSARIWHARTGAVLFTLGGHDDEVTGVAFSASGRLVVTGSSDRTVRLWVLDSEWIFLEELLADAEAHVAGEARHPRWSAFRAADDLEGWLDLWQDLRRCGARPGLAAEALARLSELKKRLLETIAYLAWERGRALPSGAETLGHPLFRAYLADRVELFPALAARLGVDARLAAASLDVPLNSGG